jgi:hypothetical protein
MSQFTGLLSATGLGSMSVVTPVDVTPNAVNWSDNITTTVTNITTNGQQITGISGTITLKLNVNTSNLTNISYGINSTNSTPGSFISITSGYPFGPGDTSTFTVSNNDWLFFNYQFDYDYLCVLTTVSVINVSDGNTVLDTFQTRLNQRGSPCP